MDIKSLVARIRWTINEFCSGIIATYNTPEQIIHTELNHDKIVDVIIFIVSVGPNVHIENIMQTVYSISRNIGIQNYKYYFVVDKAIIAKTIYDRFKTNPLISNFLLKIVLSKDSWAENFNTFFYKYQKYTKYILISHDDLIVNTKNFWNLALIGLKDKKNKIAWITFTNDHYYEFGGIPLSNSVRTGFAIDRNAKVRFECHKFSGTKVTLDNYYLFDYPKLPVRCHAPFSHLMLIKTDVLKAISYCEDWSKYSLLIDEDWGMRALLLGYTNIWIPNIFYTHPNPYNSYKRIRDLRFEHIVHSKFTKKWGIDLPYSDETIKYVQKKYANTNLPWSSYRKTFEWDYLK